MKYTIFQIDDSRAQNADYIRSQMTGCWDEEENIAVDGRNYTKHFAAFEWYPRATPGQIGVWYSFQNALSLAPILTLDDDAIVYPRFGREAAQIIRELPEDTDFFALYQPPYFASLFKPRHDIGHDLICRAYQPYGAVAMYYTRQGRDRIGKLIRRDGFRMQYDNQLFQYSWDGELNGYGLKPGVNLVKHDDFAPSIIQENQIEI